jgi:hypothetical protein
MHLQVFVKLKKTLKTLSSGQKSLKKPKKPKKPKNPKKRKKKQKNPLGWFFLKNPGFFQPCVGEGGERPGRTGTWLSCSRSHEKKESGLLCQ